MSKPTYEELERRFKGLEKKALHSQQIKEAIIEREERFRRIAEAVTDYVFSVRIENGLPVETVHGPNCVAVTGYVPEEFDSDPYLWIEMVYEEDQGLVKEQAHCILLGKEVQPIEHRILRKDGVIRWVRNTLVPHYAQQGNLLSYDGIVRDINKRKQAEAELKKAHEELESRIEKRTAELIRANAKLKHEIEERRRLEKVLIQKEKLKTLGVVVAEVAHEIRNPLVSVGGFAKRLKKKYPDLPECDIILSEAERLEKILSRIRMYLDPVEINSQECYFNEIITDCLKDLSFEMEQKRVRCVSELRPLLTGAYADPEILSRIISNLLSHTTDWIAEGGSLFIKTFESGQSLHIEFKSQVKGLNIKNPETLFMPFAEGDPESGLPFCYRLLKNMDGFISFVQEKDAMIFTVSLPKIVEPPMEKNVQDHFPGMIHSFSGWDF